MKRKHIALLLLLATLLGVFACSAPMAPVDGEEGGTESPTFIGGKSEALNEGASIERPASLLNFGLTDKNGKAEFQIAYKTSMSILVQNECENLANAIKETTEVEIPIVNDIAKEKKRSRQAHHP